MHIVGYRIEIFDILKISEFRYIVIPKRYFTLSSVPVAPPAFLMLTLNETFNVTCYQLLKSYWLSILVVGIVSISFVAYWYVSMSFFFSISVSYRSVFLVYRYRIHCFFCYNSDNVSILLLQFIGIVSIVLYFRLSVSYLTQFRYRYPTLS